MYTCNSSPPQLLEPLHVCDVELLGIRNREVEINFAMRYLELDIVNRERSQSHSDTCRVTFLGSVIRSFTELASLVHWSLVKAFNLIQPVT